MCRHREVDQLASVWRAGGLASRHRVPVFREDGVRPKIGNHLHSSIWRMSGWISTKLADVGHSLHTIERGAVGGNCRYPAISILPPDSTRATLPSLAPTSTPRPAYVNNPTGTGQSRTSPDQIHCSLLRQTTVNRLQYPRITRRVSFFSDRTLLPRSVLSPPAAATAQGSRGTVAILSPCTASPAQSVGLRMATQA